MSNRAPRSYPVAVETAENGLVTIRVFFQDLDLEDTHTLVLNTEEMIGTGTVTSDDMFQYDPGAAFDHLAPGETATDTFSYTITDAAGETSTATVTITLTGQNDGPVAVALAEQTDEQTAINISPSFSDPDTNDSHTFEIDTTGTIGTVKINEDGTFSYDPNGKFDYLNDGETAVDTFSYTVKDAAGETSTETVTVTVTGLSPNTPPITYPVALNANEDGRIAFRIIFQDPDIGDTHTYSVNTSDLDGVLTETGDGLFEYTPNPAFDYLAQGETGIDTFTYTVTDNHGGSHTSTVTLTIIGENDAPVATEVNVSTTESTAIAVTPDFIDPDGTDTHTFTIDTSSTTGSVTVNPDGTFTYDPNGKFYALNRGEQATDSFTYTVTDNHGASSTETVNVTIHGESEAVLSPAKLFASDAHHVEYFGYSSQLNDHGVIVVGAYSGRGEAPSSGAVYVYQPNEDGVLEETKIVASDGEKLDHFGKTVAINNAGTIVVCSSQEDTGGDQSGAVYVYKPLPNGEYSELKLTPSDSAAGDALGKDLAINSNGVIAASAFGTEEDSVYIFTPNNAGGYTEQQLFLSNDGNDLTRAFSLNDNGVLFVGGKGTVSVFSPSDTGEYTEHVITAPETYFGRSGVIANDGTIAIADFETLYVYQPDGLGDYTITKLESEAWPSDYNLDMNDEGVIVAGAKLFKNKAFVFIPDAEGGYHQITLTPYDLDRYDQFGWAVSINDEGVITVGNPDDHDKGRDTGSVYIFTPDGDGNYVGPDGTVYEPSAVPSLEITGSDAAETLLGGADADVILGNAGDDVIDGGAGSDTLEGGLGNDTFHFSAGENGHDVIVDFEAGAGTDDVIELDASLFDGFDAVLASVTDQDGATVISIDTATSITLEGVHTSDLHQDDFAFL